MLSDWAVRGMVYLQSFVRSRPPGRLSLVSEKVNPLQCLGCGTSRPTPSRSRNEYWHQTARDYGAALERLAWVYEPDPDRRRDLLQEIYLALWRSFENFDGRCSLRTWIYRVAHNVAISRVTRRKRNAPVFLSLEEIEAEPTLRASSGSPTVRRQLPGFLRWSNDSIC